MMNKPEIIDRLLKRDQLYFSKLYTQYEDMLKNTAIKLTGSEINAENLLFVTFKKLWESPHSFAASNDQLISTYLMKQIVYNHLYDQRKQKAR
ncbi:sigma factor [Peribacillus sp. SI8-4]|uniref:sigma factor n=1 Tax=Peribacillus sp. SI8-4 TaxID=3048009 RepID=UPI002557938C|nr:sigma factor [Peribacillus sp. SI8-4]